MHMIQEASAIGDGSHVIDCVYAIFISWLQSAV